MRPSKFGCVGWRRPKATNCRQSAHRKNLPENDAMKTTKEPALKGEGDLVLQETWRIKDELSAARGHDVRRLFAEARKRQKLSGHPVVNLHKRLNRKA